jgi:hypothetical protein
MRRYNPFASAALFAPAGTGTGIEYDYPEQMAYDLPDPERKARMRAFHPTGFRLQIAQYVNYLKPRSATK